MKNILSSICILILLLSCNRVDKQVPKRFEDKKLSHNFDNKLSWIDSAIIKYIDQSDNQLIILSKRDTSIHIQWMLDRIEKTDRSNYFVYRIGHDVSDDNGSSLRFVSDAWLYIDSLTKLIYEYDAVNDTIRKWEKSREK